MWLSDETLIIGKNTAPLFPPHPSRTRTHSHVYCEEDCLALKRHMLRESRDSATPLSTLPPSSCFIFARVLYMGGVVLSVTRPYWMRAPQRVDDAKDRALAQPMARYVEVLRCTQLPRKLRYCAGCRAKLTHVEQRSSTFESVFCFITSHRNN